MEHEEGYANLDDEFDASVNLVGTDRGVARLDENLLLFLYGRYKIATEGPCTIPKPRFYEFTALKKWETWKSLDGLSRESAKAEYVRCVKENFPSNDARISSNDSENPNRHPTSFGPSVSKFLIPDECGNTVATDIACGAGDSKIDKNLHIWFESARNGDLDAMTSLFAEHPEFANAKDSSGMTALLWASDRGNLHIVRWLLEKVKVYPDGQDSIGQTPLHYASCCDHVTVARVLLEHGANLHIFDNEGDSPLNVCSSKEMDQLFVDYSDSDRISQSVVRHRAE